MAKNFSVRTKKGRDKDVSLHLFGDFDGSSAWELIHILDESIKKSNKVAIDTDGLKTIGTFGLSVFLPRMSWLQDNRADIEVTGRFYRAFQE